MVKVAALREAAIRFLSFLRPAKNLAINAPRGALDEYCKEDYSMFWGLLHGRCPQLEKMVFACNKYDGEGIESLVKVEDCVKHVYFISEMKRPISFAQAQGYCQNIAMDTMCFEKFSGDQ